MNAIMNDRVDQTDDGRPGVSAQDGEGTSLFMLAPGEAIRGPHDDLDYSITVGGRVYDFSRFDAAVSRYVYRERVLAIRDSFSGR